MFASYRTLNPTTDSYSTPKKGLGYEGDSSTCMYHPRHLNLLSCEAFSSPGALFLIQTHRLVTPARPGQGKSLLASTAVLPFGFAQSLSRPGSLTDERFFDERDPSSCSVADGGGPGINSDPSHYAHIPGKHLKARTRSWRYLAAHDAMSRAP